MLVVGLLITPTITVANADAKLTYIPDSTLSALSNKISISKAKYGECTIFCLPPTNRTNLLVSDLGILRCINLLVTNSTTQVGTGTCDGQDGIIVNNLAILSHFTDQIYDGVNQTKIKQLGFEYLREKGISDNNETLTIP